MSKFFRSIQTKISILLVFFLASVSLYPGIVYGASTLPIRDPSYAASYVGQSIADPVTVEAGTTKTVVFRFKNVGTSTWEKTGKRYLSAYTDAPRGRASLFVGKNWESPKQTATIAKKTKPGSVAELVIDLTAPDKPGTYTEYFHLAADGHTWVKGGSFFIKITVTPRTTAAITPPTASSTGPYQANKFIQSVQTVAAAGGERIALVLGFENSGQAPWPRYAIVTSPATALASADTQLSFADELWQSRTVIVEKTRTVAPSEFVREEISFRAPAVVGSYTAHFQLQVDGVIRPEADVVISVMVTANAPDGYVAPKSDEGMPPAPPITYRLGSEPLIRVGIWKPEVAVQFLSSEDDYVVKQGAEIVGTLTRGTVATLAVGEGGYTFQGGEMSFTTASYIRLEPVTNPHAVFTLPTLTRTVSWKGPRNFNAYRGTLEYRRTEGGTLYAINELSFEDYIAGISETSNLAPIEYIKAILTAARTYAYHIKAGTKHESRYFDVVATTGDQLYLGYESERLMPRVVEAARATRGQMVTYDNNIVITPYFANTDGRTRAWTEVWGGTPKPWLQPVRADYDLRDGKKMYGHGVGMSARDASIRAEEEGMDYQALLKYYYTGVMVEKVYE